MKLKFDTRGNEKQKDFCKAYANPEKTELYYFGVKGAAKSFTVVSCLFADAFMYPGTKYFIARNQLNDLRKYTTSTVLEVFELWGLNESYYNFNGSDNFWTLSNGSTIYYIEAGFVPRDPLFKRFGSQQYTRGWIEETGELEEASKRNLASTVGRWKNDVFNIKRKLIMTGNPCQNFIYDIRKKYLNGNLEAYQEFIETNATDNKAISSGYYEGLEQSLSIEEKERLLYNNWDYSNDPTVLPESDAIQDLFNNEHVKPNNKIYASADLAMQGRDNFIAAPWNGLVCDLTKGIDKPKSTGKSIELDLKNLMIFNSIPRSQTIVDSDGMGNYIESYLTGIKEFHAQSRAVNSIEFANIKAECGYKLAELINKRLIRIICTPEQKARIIRELGVLRSASLNASEKRKSIISKDVMKKILGYSPDYLDMLIMRMYFELKPSINLNAIRTIGTRLNYDKELGLI